jgi:hypothetical protein
LAGERKSLEETRLTILTHVLTAHIRDDHPNSREEELANREKWQAERQFQEFATTRKWLEELHTTWEGEAQKVWDFLS